MSSRAPARDARGGRPRGRALRRVDVRLTLWFVAIFLLTALLLFGFTFVNLYQTLREEDRRELQGRALGYVVRYRASANERAGINFLVNQLGNDILTPSAQPFFARIVTATNDQLFMAIPVQEWQQIDLSPLTEGTEPHDSGFMTVSAEAFGYELEVLGVKLSDAYVLQLGADNRIRVQVLRVFQASFLLTFVVMLAVSLAGGLFFTSRSLRPIGSLSATVRSIIETGQLDRRVPARHSDDELDELTRSVNAMLDRIQALVNGLRDALDSVAHDLRTPLTRLRSTAERALSGPAGEGELREALSDALEESERILGMLNAMMDISEAESGAMRLRRRPVDLGRLAAEVAEVYAVVAEEHAMTITVSSVDGLVVSADPSRLRQVIGNLCDNAVKYGRAGTGIVVEATQAPGRVAAQLSVTNRGEPIPPHDLERIWNRLYRGTSSGDRRDGLGLGLALVRAIVTAHGGSVSVSSDAERTRFTVDLPLAEGIDLSNL